ncbi:MAG: hypothetical protein E7160_04560 [Firmicutes bacterium]|nr:hypothetical protein [Bacillota bacterium]
MGRVIYTKDYLDFPDSYKFVDLEKLDSLMQENITDIYFCDSDVLGDDENKLVREITDSDHPLILRQGMFSFDKGYSLCINTKWYLENNEVVDKLVENIVSCTLNNEISINSQALITDKVIEGLCSNRNLEDVSLCRYNKIEAGYILDEDAYHKFKNSNIKEVHTTGVSESLNDNFDPLIGYNSQKCLIGINRYKDLISGRNIYIDEIKDDEVGYLKYLNSESIVKIKQGADYNRILNCLKSVGKYNKVVIEVKDKDKFNKDNLDKNYDYPNLEVAYGTECAPFELYKKSEKLLYEMIEPCMNLSPFEKYIYIYNIVKQFKKYNEVKDDDLFKSRHLYDILYNDYMVCVGFSNLLGDLLIKAGIESKDLSVSVDVSYDNVEDHTKEIEAEDISAEYAGHARRYVHIVDPKYGIDGLYQSDPTWDNVLNTDLYNHMVMTDNEVSDAKRYLRIFGPREVFNVSNMDEYYEKLNFNLERPVSRYNKNLPTKRDLLIDIIDIIKCVDSGFYNKIISEYNLKVDSFGRISTVLDSEQLNSVFEYLGHYIVEHVNKKISSETIFAAVSNVYKNAYGFSEEEIRKMLPKVILDNKEAHEMQFPKRYKIDSSGNEEVYMNEENKFDTDTSALDEMLKDINTDYTVDNNKTI